MWEVRNETPFAADRIVVIDKHGARAWVVVIKATFDIQPNGTLKNADEQLPPTIAPEYRGKDGESSLVYEQDLIAAKPSTDVYLNAVAHAPHGRPCTELVVGLRMPWGQKTLAVRGDRVWERNLMGVVEPSPPRPFVEMPIIYERAYGGYDKQDPDPGQHRLYPGNPVGTGMFTRGAHRLGKLMPNIELPGKPFDAGPAGFGALCSYWEPRISFQGTYDAHWIEHRRPLLPADYDPRVLQCAPLDQQAPHLRGGERFGLVNMNPRFPAIDFELPKHYFGFTTAIGSKRLEHRAKINTVIIEPEHPRVMVVWQSTLECHHDIDDIDFTLVTEKQYV